MAEHLIGRALRPVRMTAHGRSANPAMSSSLERDRQKGVGLRRLDDGAELTGYPQTMGDHYGPVTSCCIAKGSME